MYSLNIDMGKCDLCLECRDICVSEALTFNPDKKEFIFDADICNYCEVCMDICDREAIKITCDFS